MKILYACNDLDYFRAHRLFLANAMSQRKWDVLLSTGVVHSEEDRSDLNYIRILYVKLDRHKLNFKTDLSLIRNYYTQLKQEKPDVVHAITIKPILFMGIALLLNKMTLQKTPKFVVTYPGLGKVFEPSTTFKTSIRKFLVSRILELSNKILKSHATFENYTSMEELTKERVVTKQRASVVMGAGLDKNQFYSTKRKGDLTVLFASRLLKAKGLGEYIEAAKNLKKDFPKVKFQVAGKQELDNPDAFKNSDIISANNSGDIEFIGSILPEEMPEVLRKVDIHVAPSKLQEGLPRVVLEAASCGCCIIASDHEMLSQFVKEDETGWLLKEVSVTTIEAALRVALSNSIKTRKMGELVAKKTRVLPIFEDSLIAHFSDIYQS